MSNEHDLFQKDLSEAQTYPDALNHVSDRLEQRIKKERRRKGTFYGSLSVIAASLLFILLVNTSTSFVYALSEIPILNRISQMVLFDESLKSALDNDYIQYVGLKETHGEETLKLPYVIADEQNLVLFFQTNEESLAPEEMYEIELNHLRDTDTGTFHSQGYYAFSSMQPDNFSENLGLMQLKVQFSEMVLPRNIEVTINLWKTININGEFTRTGGDTFTFPISLNEFEKPKTYPIDKEILIEGVKITFDQMEVYPTGTMLHYRTWKDTLDDVALQFDLLEDGRRTSTSTNFSRTSFGEKYDKHTLRLGDDFFNQPKTRSLLISGYYYLEAGKKDVTLDIQNKTLSQSIENMELLDVTQLEDMTTLVFRATTSPSEPPVQDFRNEKGNRLKIIKTRYTTNAEKASYVYEIETKKTPTIIMRVSPTFTNLGKDAIEIPISIPSR